MAPQTNIGSATPISVGPGSDDAVLGRKIPQRRRRLHAGPRVPSHGRNPDLGEEMVPKGGQRHRPARPWAQNFIDMVAPSETAPC